MIRFENVSKSFGRGRSEVAIAKGISGTLPPRRTIGLLGRNGAGKSSLLKMIAGTLLPDRGRIRTRGRVSWPIGFAGSFHGDLTGAQNTRFLARVYGVDSDELCDMVQDFTELDTQFFAPVKTYSAGMRARLSFGVSMGIPFDTYLVDEVTSVGDAQFRTKSKELFLDRMEACGGIIVSHSLPLMAEICTHGAVLERGQLTFFNDIEAAIERHLELVHGHAAQTGPRNLTPA